MGGRVGFVYSSIRLFVTEELMQHLEYMTAAYIIIWVAILLYFLSLSKREKAIWEELRELRATITKNKTP